MAFLNHQWWKIFWIWTFVKFEFESLLNGTKLDLPDLPSHSQAMEWGVKLTTEASQTVYGFEARHQYITAKVLSQKLRTAFMSKGSYREQLDSIY